MNPPIVLDEISPSSHRATRTMAIVSSMIASPPYLVGVHFAFRESNVRAGHWCPGEQPQPVMSLLAGVGHGVTSVACHS